MFLTPCYILESLKSTNFLLYYVHVLDVLYFMRYLPSSFRRGSSSEVSGTRVMVIVVGPFIRPTLFSRYFFSRKDSKLRGDSPKLPRVFKDLNHSLPL